jgi:hypothetical protein
LVAIAKGRVPCFCPIFGKKYHCIRLLKWNWIYLDEAGPAHAAPCAVEKNLILRQQRAAVKTIEGVFSSFHPKKFFLGFDHHFTESN